MSYVDLYDAWDADPEGPLTLDQLAEEADWERQDAQADLELCEGTIFVRPDRRFL